MQFHQQGKSFAWTIQGLSHVGWKRRNFLRREPAALALSFSGVAEAQTKQGHLWINVGVLGGLGKIANQSNERRVGYHLRR